MFRLLKLMITGAIGYLLYKLITDVANADFQSGTSSASGGSSGGTSQRRSGSTGQRRGQRVATEGQRGEGMSHQVGRGVTS